MEQPKRLMRSNNRVLGGVCGGIAEYMNVDPTVVRAAYLILTFCTIFSGFFVYLILWVIMPEKYQ
ncbi:MAG: PspC domain-containing protein [Prevotellaceae bacterium]|nr:PspC domain-containing protein [Prevotella sp.]MDD7258359.1 PspC domain-containing protein [Prevotellaceae bacterium]MDY6129917.1 PspC domain-containing protein [Prevotella sp.]